LIYPRLICGDDHHGDYGPYCQDCEGAVLEALKSIIRIKEAAKKLNDHDLAAEVRKIADAFSDPYEWPE